MRQNSVYTRLRLGLALNMLEMPLLNVFGENMDKLLGNAC